MKKIAAEKMDQVLFADVDGTTPVFGGASVPDQNPFTVRSFLRFRVGQGVQEKPPTPENIETFLAVLAALKAPGDVVLENKEHALLVELIPLFKIQQIGIYMQLVNAVKSAENYVLPKI